MPVERRRLDAAQNAFLDKMAFSPPTTVMECQTAAPAPAPLLPPAPQGKVVGLLCVRHGEYVLPINAKSDMCPSCIAEGEAAERKLFSLLPNGLA